MDIKNKKSTTTFFKPKRRSLKFVLSFLIISFIALLFFMGGVYLNSRYKIDYGTVKRWPKQIIQMLPYHTKALYANPERIFIHIKHTDYQHLEYEREEALASDDYIRTGVDFTYVPAEIEYEGNFIPVKIRLKGDRHIHYNHENEWSFRIKVKNENTVFHMKKFSIQKPHARNYIYEWIFHQVLEREGLISGRYLFAEVSVNGNNLGMYAFEEHFEKRLIENNRLREAPILRFEENWSGDYHVNLIPPFDEKSLADSTQLSYYKKANQLLDGFRKEKLLVSDVFDPEKLGKYFAITDLLQMPHGALWKSIRFYYNPVTSRLEPIGYDGHYRVDNMYGKQYLSCEIGINPEAGYWYDFNGDWLKMIFNKEKTFDHDFIFSYFNSLWQYTNPEYLDALFEDIDDELENNLTILARDFPLLADHSSSLGPDLFTFSIQPFYDRQENIRNKLNNVIIYAHLDKIENDKIYIKIGNPETLPIIVKGLSIKDTIYKVGNNDFILPARDEESYQDYKLLTFQCDTSQKRIFSDSLNYVKIIYSLPGWGQSHEAAILPYPPPEELDENLDLVRIVPSFDNIPFIQIDSTSNSVYIKKGKWIIDEDIVFPSGFKVYATGDTELDIVKNACILSYSPLYFRGSDDSRLKIYSSDTSGQGLAILNVNETSRIENVIFENLSNISKPGWILPSSITFYESDVFVNNCVFKNNQSEDCLNIIRSNFTISDSEFHGTYSDAFDADFADGTFSNCKFINCGNDGIDISGSKVFINDVFMDSIGDKGLSAGENSEMKAKNVTITNAEIAVASKDLSELSAESINVSDSRIGYTAFQKKAEFGGAVINVINGTLINVELPYLMEENSLITVDGTSRIADRADVKEILYGVEYGKSSKVVQPPQ